MTPGELLQEAHFFFKPYRVEGFGKKGTMLKLPESVVEMPAVDAVLELSPTREGSRHSWTEVFASEAHRNIEGKGVVVPATALMAVLDVLENCPRVGDPTDVPEGSRRIGLSDTLARRMAKELRGG